MSHEYDAQRFCAMVGKTLVNIEQIENDELIFTSDEGDRWRMYHEQDCCESVEINDIIGDIADLIGHPLLVAECREQVADNEKGECDEYGTWTFYELATIKGSVTLRWLGKSNGYYSESVSFEQLPSLEEFLKHG